MAEPSSFITQRVAMTMPLPSAWERRAVDGARIALDAMLLRYHAALGGVLVAYGALTPATTSAAAGDAATGIYLSSHLLPAAPTARGRDGARGAP